MSKLDDLQTQPRVRGMCRRCGQAKAEAQVLVALRRLNDQGRPSQQITSVARNVCEDCAVEVYQGMAESVRTVE